MKSVPDLIIIIIIRTIMVVLPTGGDHSDGGLIHHADDGDRHADTLGVQMKEHEESDD